MRHRNHAHFAAKIAIATLVAIGARFASGDVKIEPLPIDAIGVDTVSCSVKDAPFDELIKKFEEQTGISVNATERKPGTIPAVVYSIDVKDADPLDALNQLGISVGMMVQGDATSTSGRLLQGTPGLATRIPLQKPPPAGAEATAIYREQNVPANQGSDRVTLSTMVRAGKPLLERGIVEVKSATDDAKRELKPRPQTLPESWQRRLVTETSADVTFDCPQPGPKTLAKLTAEAVVQAPKTAQRITIAPMGEAPATLKLIDIDVRISAIREENQQLIVDIVGVNVAEIPTERQWFRDVSRLRIEDAKRQRFMLKPTNAAAQEKDFVVKAQIVPQPQRGNQGPLDRKTAKLTWDVVTEVDTVRLPLNVENLPIP
jgi:hypothetical protein